MIWVYFWLSMPSLEEFVESEEQPLLTMREATKILRIGRTLGYALAHEYLNSGGASGLPVVRFSKECYRVPRWALIELVTTGRVVRLCDAEAPVEGVSVAR
jgi:hypothetical protein